MLVVEYLMGLHLNLLSNNTASKEENKSSSSTIFSSKNRSKNTKMEADLSSSSISNNDHQDELLKSAKVKMDEVREENERLKKLLAHFMKEYNSLEKQISSMARSKGSSEIDNPIENHSNKEELVCLSLGSWSSNKRYDEDAKKQVSNSPEKRRKVGEGLELGLDCKFEQYTKDVMPSDSVNNSGIIDSANDHVKKEDNNGIVAWPPSRDLKAKENTNNGGASRDRDEESLHQPQVKKTRVCIRSRCDSPTVHDGCQWRKYGQKIAKGNPCPRAYYRCTVSSNCPVRKQVQRCPQDMSILITTYEGTHNHPLPLSATAMASATSAAAAMLKTGSLTSQQSLNTSNLPTTSSYGLQTSNLITTFNNNPSMITAASHNSHPTVTLDLTTANPDFSPFSWSSTPSRNSSSFLNFSSTSSCSPSLDFTSSAPSNTIRANNSNYNLNNNYGTLLFPHGNNNNHNNSTSINNNNDISRSIYQSLNSHHQALNDTIAAAATKAIASNPNFQSVLEAAISSYVGNKGNNDPKKPSFSWNNNSNNNNNNSSSQLSSEGGSLMLFPTPLSTLKSNNPSKNAAADARDNST